MAPLWPSLTPTPGVPDIEDIELDDDTGIGLFKTAAATAATAAAAAWCFPIDHFGGCLSSFISFWDK